MLDVSATVRQKDGEIALFVVNYLNEPQTRKIDVSDLSVSDKLISVWTLSGTSLDAVNSFQEKDRVAPVGSAMEFNRNAFEHEFPAHSVTILRFK